MPAALRPSLKSGTFKTRNLEPEITMKSSSHHTRVDVHLKLWPQSQKINLLQDMAVKKLSRRTKHWHKPHHSSFKISTCSDITAQTAAASHDTTTTNPLERELAYTEPLPPPSNQTIIPFTRSHFSTALPNHLLVYSIVLSAVTPSSSPRPSNSGSQHSFLPVVCHVAAPNPVVTLHCRHHIPLSVTSSHIYVKDKSL